MSQDRPTYQPNTMQRTAEALDIAATLQALASAALQPVHLGEHVHVIVPGGYQLHDISKAVEATQLLPNRKQGTVELSDLESFLAYCKDQAKEEFGYVYADPEKLTIVAVFNDLREAPGWRDHRAVLKLQFTPEFSRWKSNSGQLMEQQRFAEFLEDNLMDISEPAAADLLTVATTLQAKTDISFSSSKRLDNGQTQLQYSEVINASARGATGALEIPREFRLGLRLFKNGGGYALRARLKFRLSAGAVKFLYELERPERSIEDAFGGYVARLREELAYQVLLGTP